MNNVHMASAPQGHGRSPLRFVQTLVVSVLLVVLSGCASSLSRVETWEGDPDSAADAATLEAPGAIQVARVNGRTMSNFLVDDLALDYALLPGEAEVVFSYKTIWAKSGVVENDEAKVHVYTSKPQVVRFKAEPGQVYRFQFEKPTTKAEAERVTESFQASVVTAGGQPVAESAEWQPSESVSRTPIPQADAVVGDQGSALETLKSVWATASEEEKKAFLRWAFE